MTRDLVTGVLFAGLAGWGFSHLPTDAQIGLGGAAFAVIVGVLGMAWMDSLE